MAVTTITGTSGNNLISGTAGNDLILGLGGNDTLDGGLGTDTMKGGDGNDTYYVDNIKDVITEIAAQGTDSVYTSVSYTISPYIENLTLSGTSSINATGNAIANSITGNEGNNILDGRAGADTMTGNDGDDTYIVDNIGDVVSENSGEGTDTVISSVAYTLGDYIENLTLGGTGAINAYGNSLSNTLTGNSGNNKIYGNDGNDMISGGAGNDSIYGGADDDTIYGGLGNDWLNANDGNNLIYGGAGNDTIFGNTGTDTMYGGIGNDVYFVDETDDIVTENSGQGIDTVYSAIDYTLGSYLENLTLSGTASIDGVGNALANKITGNSGDNTLNGGAGADTMRGGAGNDTYYVDMSRDVIAEIAGQGTDTVYSSASYILSANVENLTLTGISSINATGNGLANVITGNSGNNTINGGAGADTMIGGDGNDLYYVDNIGDSISELSGEGTDKVSSTISYSLGDYVENLTLTGVGNNIARGNSLDNNLIGNSGTNKLYGFDGDDYLFGGYQGKDTLEGGDGNDILIGYGDADSLVGGNGDDTYWLYSDTHSNPHVILELSNSGTDTVYSKINYALGDNLENLILSGTDATQGFGNAFGNSITGNELANVLYGFAGNDTLKGGDGNDLLLGGDGDDSLYGGAGADGLKGENGNDTYYIDSVGDNIVEYAAGGTADLVRASISFTLVNYVENLTLIGTSNINGSGNALANTITGNSGNNILTGGGNDTLLGGNGNDTYVINTGDTVIETSTGGNADCIQIDISYTLGDYIENLTLTGTSNLNGTGNELSNTLTGNSGHNILTGGNGNDTYVIGTGDTVIETSTGGDADCVQIDISYTLGDYIENLTLTGTSDIDATGNDLSNTLTGNSGNNILTGGNGNDTYIINSTDDTIIETSTGGDADLVQSSISYTLGDYIENLTLTGTADIDATGNELANTLTGNSGNNILSGGDGNDTLEGKAGNDTIDGGVGNDTYLLTTGDKLDSITDSAGVSDQIILGSSVDTNKIAFYVSTDSLYIDYGDTTGEDKVIVNNWTTTGVIEQIQLNDGSFLTSTDINNAIQAMTTYANDHSISMTSVDDVKNNSDLMNIIINSWHSS